MTGGAPRPLLVLADSAGGIGRHVAAVVSGCSAAGVRVRVAGPARLDDRFGFTERGAVFVPVPVALRIPADRIDVVHAHGLRAGAVAVAAARLRSAPWPVVVSWHNALPSRSLLATRLERFVARRADVTLTASADLAERARALGARDVRPGPVAAPAPGPAGDPAATRAELDLGWRPLVLSVGRLAPQKDWPTLLTAARAWRDVDPAPVLAIAGAGPLRQLLADRIDAERLPVRLLGPRDDVTRLLAAADVAVLSSVWEARSLFAQEALRAGVPLVATAVGGIGELVGDAAVLVPPGEPAALGDAVLRVLREPGLRARLRSAGPARAAQWPTQEQITAGLLGLYAELASRQGPGAARYRPFKD